VPKQESEAFVVVLIPRRTFGSDNPRGSEGTPLVPQERSAVKDVVTARKGYQRPKPFRNCQIALDHGAIERWQGDQWNSESRMRENRLSGLMRGGE